MCAQKLKDERNNFLFYLNSHTQSSFIDYTERGGGGGGALSETTRQSVVESKWRDRALANSTQENNKNDRKKKRNTQTKSEHDHFPSMDKNQNNKLNIKKE